jgi:hypothetical protein
MPLSFRERLLQKNGSVLGNVLEHIKLREDE